MDQLGIHGKTLNPFMYETATKKIQEFHEKLQIKLNKISVNTTLHCMIFVFYVLEIQRIL